MTPCSSLFRRIEIAYFGPQAPDDEWVDTVIDKEFHRRLKNRCDDETAHLSGIWDNRPSRLPWLASLDKRSVERRRLLDDEFLRFRLRPWVLLIKPEKLSALVRSLTRMNEPEAAREIRDWIEMIRRGESPPTGHMSKCDDLPSPGVLLVLNEEQILPTGFLMIDPENRSNFYMNMRRPDDENAATAWDNAIKLVYPNAPQGSFPRPVLPVMDFLKKKIDGGSFSLTLWLFLWLHLHRVAIPHKLCATGVLDCRGAIKRVDHFDLKVRAALAAGYELVLVPYENVSDNSWRFHPRVKAFGNVSEIPLWLNDMTLLAKGRRKLLQYLSGKRIDAVSKSDLEPIFHDAIANGTVKKSLNDWRDRLRQNPEWIHSNYFFLTELWLELINDRLVGSKSESGADLSLENGELVRVIGEILPERVWLFHFPFLLAMRERGIEKVVEEIYEQTHERFFDHDRDLTIAARLIEELWDHDWHSESLSRDLFWRNAGIRRKFPHLLWMFFRDPITAVSRLLKLSDPNLEEYRKIEMFIKGLKDVDKERFAGQGLFEPKIHFEPVLKAVQEYQPGFLPEMGNPPRFDLRLKELWLSWFKLASKKEFESDAAILKEHFFAHLGAKRPNGRESLIRENPALNEFGKLPGKPEDWKRLFALLRTGAGKTRPDKILKGLASAVKQARGVKVSSKPLKGWPKDLFRSFRSNTHGTGEITDRSHEFMMKNLRMVSLDLVAPSSPKALKSLRFFAQPAVFLLSNIAGKFDDKIFLEGSILAENWIEAHGSFVRQRLDMQCLFHFIGTRTNESFDSAAKICRSLMIPWFVGRTSHEKIRACDECENLNFLGVLGSAKPEEIVWLAFLPESCRGCEKLRRELTKKVERYSMNLTKAESFLRGEAEVGLSVIAYLWNFFLIDPVEVGSASEILALAVKVLKRQVREWLGSDEKPIRTGIEAVLPLLAVDADNRVGKRCGLSIFRSAYEAGNLVRILRASRGGDGCSPLSVHYWALMIGSERCREILRVNSENDGLPFLWDSSMDREMFHTILLAKTFFDGDGRRLDNVIAEIVRDLPNMSFGLELRKRFQHLQISGSLFLS